MVKADLSILMELFMKVSLSKTVSMDRVFVRVSFTSMRGNGRMVKCMETVSARGQMIKVRSSALM